MNDKEVLKSMLRAGRSWEVEAANYIEQLEQELVALKPKRMTEAELLEIQVKRLRESRLKRLEIEQLFKDQGICPECEGRKETGGQFSGGPWNCRICNGTGKYP